MNAKKWIIFSVFAFFLMFGCVDYNYIHQINEDGSSVLTISMDYTKTLDQEALDQGKILEIVIDEFKKEMNEKCIEIKGNDSSIECKVTQGTILEISKTYTDEQSEEIYDFKIQGTVPDNVYIVEVKKIINLDKTNDFLGINEIELGKELTQEQKEFLILLDQFDSEIIYTIQMPGEVFEAYWGNYSGEINGNSALFDLKKINENPEKIVVKSKKINEFYLYILIGIIILIFVYLLYSLFWKNFKKKEE